VTVIAPDSSPGTIAGAPIDDLSGSTSNQLPLKLGPALITPFITAALLFGGGMPTGYAAPIRTPQSATYGCVNRLDREVTPTTQEVPVSAGDETPLSELAKAVRSLRQRSGLTWDELARIFGVTRRTLYNWSIGGQVSAANAQAIAEVVGRLHGIDSGDPKVTRSRLLAPKANGDTLYASLIREVRRTPAPQVPVYTPDQLLGARHDTPDQTGKVIGFEPLD
jgi:transcriptional regulator with XRE-family HTH domain